MEKFTNLDKETLERIIDAYGLNSFLENASEICHEKAEHIRASYSDDLIADTWDRASTNLMVASEFVFSQSMTIRREEKKHPFETDENIGSVEPKSEMGIFEDFEGMDSGIDTTPTHPENDPYGMIEERKKYP